jgi:DNA repair protein RecO (recombination protein O)
MRRIVTTAIVLRRTDYGEADRIVNVLTFDQGKVTLFAKGVRKPKSKLAGGIELFSVNDITYIPGKSDMVTLVSSRVLEHFGHIVHDYDRTMTAYRLLKAVDRITESTAGEQYFVYLRELLAGLNDTALSLDEVMLWAHTRLLAIVGSLPNVLSTASGDKLDPESLYQFSIEDMGFKSDEQGMFNANSIKLIRYCAGSESPLTLKRLQADTALYQPARLLMQQVASETLNIEL